MTIGLLMLICVGFGWTYVGVVYAKAPRDNVNTTYFQICSGLVSILVSGAVIFLRGLPMVDLVSRETMVALGLYVMVNIITYPLNELMAVSMKRGPSSLVWAILQSGTVIPFVVGLTCHGVPAKPSRLIGMALVLVALVLLMLKDKESEGEKSGAQPWLGLTILAFFLVGIQQSINNEPSYHGAMRDAVPVEYRYLFGLLINVIVSLIGGLARGMFGSRAQVLSNIKSVCLWRYTIPGVAVGLFLGLCLTYRAMDHMAKLGVGAISYPVMVMTSIVGFAVYSVLCLGERLRLRSVIGLIFSVLGICLLSI